MALFPFTRHALDPTVKGNVGERARESSDKANDNLQYPLLVFVLFQVHELLTVQLNGDRNEVRVDRAAHNPQDGPDWQGERTQETIHSSLKDDVGVAVRNIRQTPRQTCSLALKLSQLCEEGILH